jgi:hypothetical protein
MQEAGCDHEAYAIKDTACAQGQFCAMGMSVSNGKEADNNCGNPQFWPCLTEDGEPKRQSGQRDAQFNAWEFDAHQAHHAAKGHHHGEDYRQQPYSWSAKLRTPHPYCNHRENVVQSGEGMLEAAGKTDRLAAAFVRKSHKRIKE